MASKGLNLCLCPVPHTEHNSTDFIEWGKYSHTRSKNQTECLSALTSNTRGFCGNGRTIQGTCILNVLVTATRRL